MWYAHAVVRRTGRRAQMPGGVRTEGRSQPGRYGIRTQSALDTGVRVVARATVEYFDSTMSGVPTTAVLYQKSNDLGSPECGWLDGLRHRRMSPLVRRGVNGASSM